MKYRRMVLRVGLGLLLCCSLLPQPGQAAAAPDLQITQLNITGEEYVTIQNTSTTNVDLSHYWLGYASSDTATAVPSQQLSEAALQPQQTTMLSNGAAATCGAVSVDNLVFSLANTAGTLALWRLDSPVSGSASFSFLGAVSWGKGASSGNYLHIADEANVAKYNTTNAMPVWLRGSGTWQVGDQQACLFTPVISATVVQEPVSVSWLSSSDTPPFSVLPAATVSSGSSTNVATIPASDIGLKAVQLSELLPNPASPHTDADDEFIELYNPNDRAFDMSGFKLQIASMTAATVHSYTIPAGTVIAAKGFKAFRSADTNLALNNSGGQVWFVDPLNNTVSTSGVYGTLAEGNAWINTGSKWQETSQPTPGAANKLSAPAAKNNRKKSATVNGRKVASLNGGKSAVAGASTSTAYDEAAQTAPLHPGTLVAVVGLAVLYLAYEYRRDVANKYRQFRQHRAARP